MDMAMDNKSGGILSAFLFPGQGSQYVGMGRQLYDRHPEIRPLYETARKVLGYDLAGLCFEGPEEKLRLTEHAQPAILITSLAAAAVLDSLGLKARFVAGHSLGEYSALVYAGGLTLEDGLELVRIRGELMSEVVPAGQGAMAAVLGLTAEEVERLCRGIEETVVVANLNCPGQVVVSGMMAGVFHLGQLAREKGARMVIPLEVSGPFHSPLMEAAAEEFRAYLKKAVFRDLAVPLVANVDAGPHEKAEELPDILARQIASPVRWEEGIRMLVADGVQRVFEVGPKKVLAGLMKRIDSDVEVFTTDGVDDIAYIRKVLSPEEEAYE